MATMEEVKTLSAELEIGARSSKNRAYMQSWHARHPEKRAEYKQRYLSKIRENPELLEAEKQKRRAAYVAQRQATRDPNNAQQRTPRKSKYSHQTPQERLDRIKAKQCANMKKYYERHPEKYRQHLARCVANARNKREASRSAPQQQQQQADVQ